MSVAVTGLGVVSALGVGRTSFLEGLREGRCALTPVGTAPAIAGPARSSRADRLGLAAALEAVRDADLSPERLRGAAVVLGVGAGGADELASYLEAHDAKRPARPSLLVEFPPANTADAIARALGAGGPVLSIMTACSASAMALGRAADLVRTGRAGCALAGGAEALTQLTLGGFGALRALSPEPCRPFDAERRGLSIGEGAAVLVLEDTETARARGARVLAELCGFGASVDGYHMTAPHPEGDGAVRAMSAALADAGLPPERIDYVNAHGTGTLHNDPAEARAINRIFGAHRPRVSSTKSQIGHTLGAAGALEAAATVLALAEGFLPATVTLRRPDPACDLAHVMAPMSTRPRAALSNSFGFGGNNVTLAFRGSA